MCVWCDGVGSLGGFAIESRPTARLGGVHWSGSHADAVAGGLAAAMRSLRERVLEEHAFAPGPVVVVTLPGRGDRVECFAGARLADAATAPGDLAELAVPAADYVLVNHHRSDGDAIDRYGALLGWMRDTGLPRDASSWQHREEYPLYADFVRPETVRLMVPVRLPHDTEGT